MAAGSGLHVEGREYQLNGRTEHTTVAIDDSLYLWCGAQSGLPLVHDSPEKRKVTSNVQIFSLSSGKWNTHVTKGIPPLGVLGYTCSAVTDKLYYFGGYCGHGVCHHNSVNQLDTSSLTWTELKPTVDDRPVMRRGWGGMITVECDEGVHQLLMIGGVGSPPTTQLPQADYTELSNGNWRTNEHSLYNISTGEWSNPSITGQCIPPASSFVTERINSSRAIVFGGIVNEDTISSSFYLMEISGSVVYWQKLKKTADPIEQWPVGRYAHAATIITGSVSPILVTIGGWDQDKQTLNECWLFDITFCCWTKIVLPDIVSERYGHSLSTFVLGPHRVWIVIVGGAGKNRKHIVVPDNTTLIELVLTNKKWLLEGILDSRALSTEIYQQKYLQQLKSGRREWLEQYQKPREADELKQAHKDLQQLKEQREREKRNTVDQHYKLLMKEKLLQEKDMEMQAFNKQLKEKERILQVSSDQLQWEKSKLWLSHQQFDQQLQGKERELREKERQLYEKERMLQENERLLQWKERELQKSQKSFQLQVEKEKERELQENQRLQDRERTLQEKERELKLAHKQLEEEKKVLQVSSQQLEEEKKVLQVSSQQLEEEKKVFQVSSQQLEEEKKVLQVSSQQLEEERVLQLSVIKEEKALQWAENKNSKAILQGRERELQWQERKLQEREKALQVSGQLQVEVQLYQQQLEEKERALKEKERELQLSHRQLTLEGEKHQEKERALKLANQQLKDSERALQEKEKELQLSHQQLEENEREKEREVQEKTRTLQQLQEKERALERELQEKEKEVLLFKQQLEESEKKNRKDLWQNQQLLEENEREKEREVQEMSKRALELSVHQLQEKEKELVQSQETVHVQQQQIRSQVSTFQERESCTAQLIYGQLHKEEEADVTQFQQQQLTTTSIYSIQEQQQQVTTSESSENDQQLVQNKGKLSIDDVPKLSAVLRPVDNNWYQLGQSLGVEESLLIEMKQKGDSTDDEQMKHLLEIWLEGEKEAVSKLEKAIKEIGGNNILSGLHVMKSSPVTDEQHGLLSTGQIPSVADKCVQFNYVIPSMDNLDCLSQVHIAGKKLFLVQGERAQLFNWEEYGLRIGVSEGTLSSSETAEVAVIALVGGQFLFPENTKLVSAVYAISVSGLLLKPLRLEMQHCVDLTSPAQTKYLKFAIAPVNTPTLPYKFSLVKGGKFNIGSWYGSIDRKEFCLVSILGEQYTEEWPPNEDETEEGEGEDEVTSCSSDTESSTESSKDEAQQQQRAVQQQQGAVVQQQHGAVQQQQGAVPVITGSSPAVVEKSLVPSQLTVPHLDSVPIDSTIQQQQQSTGIVEATTYAGLVYYEQKGVEDLVTFTAAKHLNTLLQYVEEKHTKAEIDQRVYFRFKPYCDSVELILNASQDEPYTGWTIRSHIKPCELLREDIDNFGTGNFPAPPVCLISVYGAPDATDTVRILHYAIPVEGVVRPVTLFIHRPLRNTCNLPSSPGITDKDPAPISNPVDVFRKNTSKLSNALGMSTNFDRSIDDFFSEGLLTMALVDDITSTTSYTNYQRGSKVTRELYKKMQTSQTPGDVLKSICDILIEQEDAQLKELGHSMKKC